MSLLSEQPQLKHGLLIAAYGLKRLNKYWPEVISGQIFVMAAMVS